MYFGFLWNLLREKERAKIITVLMNVTFTVIITFRIGFFYLIVSSNAQISVWKFSDHLKAVNTPFTVIILTTFLIIRNNE